MTFDILINFHEPRKAIQIQKFECIIGTWIYLSTKTQYHFIALFYNLPSNPSIRILCSCTIYSAWFIQFYFNLSNRQCTWKSFLISCECTIWIQDANRKLFSSFVELASDSACFFLSLLIIWSLAWTNIYLSWISIETNSCHFYASSFRVFHQPYIRNMEMR